MTPDARILIQAPPNSGGFRADQITITWLDTITPPPPHAAERLESQWQIAQKEYEARGAKLFNGPTSQLISAELVSADRLHLILAPSDFKTFLITRARDRAWFEKHAPTTIARALGNSVLLTHNDHAFLGIRSASVSAYSHRAHLIGGVLDHLGTAKLPATSAGILAHLLLELSEEASLSPDDLAERPDSPRLLAIAEDPDLGQPEAIWTWPTRLALDQVTPRLTPDEHSAALILPREPLLPALAEKLTPVARLAFDLWSRGNSHCGA